MRERYLIVTNNPLVKENLIEKEMVIYVETSLEGLLKEVRNQIHQGARLLSHPLSGSVKPGETPYKSVLITKTKGKLDQDSLLLIERAIEALAKFEDKSSKYGEKVLKDFQIVDFTLVESAIASAN